MARYAKANPGRLESLPIGTYAVTTTRDLSIPTGVIFCLKAVGENAGQGIEPGYPLSPHYLVHVGDDGTTLLPYTQAKSIMDRLKRLCSGRDYPDDSAYGRFKRSTKDGNDMSHSCELLSAAVASVVGKKEERAMASLFSPGGTHALKGEFAGMNDFEVMVYLVILPEA